MRLLLYIGGLAVIVVGVLIAVVLTGGEEEEASAPGVTAPAPDPQPAPRRYRPSVQTRRAMAVSGEEREKGMDTAGELNEKTVMHFGGEFEKKWHADREKLGRDRHKEMERLWFQGRRPRGDPESILKLEQILQEYPDTNRAACAAFELGHHYIRSRSMSMGLGDRRKKAEEYWRMVDDRYPDSLCEYNAHPAALSKLAMAAWVHRYTDPASARRLLEEVIKKHAGETDHLGQPLEATANRLLDQIK
jgi:hypothetical protein